MLWDFDKCESGTLSLTTSFMSLSAILFGKYCQLTIAFLKHLNKNITRAHTKASIWRTEQLKVSSNTKFLTSSIFSICFSSSYSSLQSKWLDPIWKVETQNCYGARCHQAWPSTVEMHYIMFKGLTWRERACFEGLHCFGRSPPRSGCLQPLVEFISQSIIQHTY